MLDGRAARRGGSLVGVSRTFVASIASCVALVLACADASAQVRLDPIWQGGMVLQRDASVVVGGTAKPGALVRIVGEWGGSGETRVAADGRFSRDFTAFGDALAAATDDVIAALARHGVKADGFFRGWGIGRALDAVAGAGTTSRLGFQTIRREASPTHRPCCTAPNTPA